MGTYNSVYFMWNSSGSFGTHMCAAHHMGKKWRLLLAAGIEGTKDGSSEWTKDEKSCWEFHPCSVRLQQTCQYCHITYEHWWNQILRLEVKIRRFTRQSVRDWSYGV